MELRTLKYFLSVVQEGSISNAAKALGVTQPTLSRQLAALEEELGKQLYNRTHKGIVLTEQGVILQRYAQSIVALADKAEAEISLPAQTIAGTVHVAMDEAPALAIVGQAIAHVRAEYPGITFEVTTGDAVDLMDGLVAGRYDVFAGSSIKAQADMNVLALPAHDEWGLLVRADAPLAQAEAAAVADLKAESLIVPDQAPAALREWVGGAIESRMTVAATYNLPSVGCLLVEQGVGSMLAIRSQVAAQGASDLAFVPLSPAVDASFGLAWPKGTTSKPAQVFLQQMRDLCDSGEGA